MTYEATSYKTLREHCFQHHDRVDRVENLVVNGMPDFNYCADRVDGWVEIKNSRYVPVRTSTAVLKNNHPLSQVQMNWFLRHTNAGGLGFIYIDMPHRRFLLSGLQADLANHYTVDQLLFESVWTAAVPTAQHEWARLREIFIGR